jgi:hypothetical protein
LLGTAATIGIGGLVALHARAAASASQFDRLLEGTSFASPEIAMQFGFGTDIHAGLGRSAS